MLSAGRAAGQALASGVLYLHGFNSGSASPKARLMQAACQQLEDGPWPCEAPQLPHRPQAAYRLAEQWLGRLGHRPLVVGSSMGGFLATCLAERHDLEAVVINPAVRPARLVEEWMGEGFVNEYTGERFTVDAVHRDELAVLTPETITPARYLLLLGTRDETLDCHDAFAAYAGCRTILHPGGDHGFSALADYLPAILAHGGRYLPPGRLTPIGLDGT
ncbi:YqiA/YcfP family alpha/beta fold hydrolase [Litchfieldella rifensis]|uniref:YqiA/YcfP family alpha/beta fold hydrolase n=1 Tax=Litchfieldella rifensis TaxID=762643 RepID=A0ABV7LLI8_9GAMM